MKLPSELKAGDSIEFRAEVERLSKDRGWPMVKFSPLVVEIDPEMITAVRLAPRPITVGAKVTWGIGTVDYTVVKIDGLHALLVEADCPLSGARHTVMPLEELRACVDERP